MPKPQKILVLEATFCKSREDNPSTMNHLACLLHSGDIPQAQVSVPIEFQQQCVCLGPFVYVNGIRCCLEPAAVNSLTVCVYCGCAVACQHRQSPSLINRRDYHLFLLHPYTTTHSRLAFLPRAPVFHHLFFIASILNQWQQMKGIISDSGALRC